MNMDLPGFPDGGKTMLLLVLEDWLWTADWLVLPANETLNRWLSGAVNCVVLMLASVIVALRRLMV